MISIRKQHIIVILVIFIVALVQSDSNEICSTHSGRRIYLDENGSGILRAANVTASSLKNVRFSVKIQYLVQILRKFIAFTSHNRLHLQFICVSLISSSCVKPPSSVSQLLI